MSSVVRSKFRNLLRAIAAGAIPGALALGAIPASSYAQQAAGVGIIEGTVRQSGTNQPLEGAQVTISAAGLGAATNSRGVYRLVNVPAREVIVKVRMVGYSPGSKTLTVAAGQTVTVDFSLSQSAISLQAVVPLLRHADANRPAPGFRAAAAPWDRSTGRDPERAERHPSRCSTGSAWRCSCIVL